MSGSPPGATLKVIGADGALIERRRQLGGRAMRVDSLASGSCRGGWVPATGGMAQKRAFRRTLQALAVLGTIEL
jgi:hypothetical protein